MRHQNSQQNQHKTTILERENPSNVHELINFLHNLIPVLDTFSSRLAGHRISALDTMIIQANDSQESEAHCGWEIAIMFPQRKDQSFAACHGECDRSAPSVHDRSLLTTATAP